MPELRRKRRREWRSAVSAVSCSAPSASKSTTADRSTLGLAVNMSWPPGQDLMKPVFLTALRTWDIDIGVLNASGAGLTDLPA